MKRLGVWWLVRVGLRADKDVDLVSASIGHTFTSAAEQLKYGNNKLWCVKKGRTLLFGFDLIIFVISLVFLAILCPYQWVTPMC